VATLLRPPANWLCHRRFPPALAALTVVSTSLGALVGIGIGMAPLVAGQSAALVQSVVTGINQIEKWLTGPPLNLHIAGGLGALAGRLQQIAPAINSGVLTGLSTLGSALLTLVLTIVLAFLFVKDGARFVPWLRRVTGDPAGPHLDAVLYRSWRVLSGFIRIQALVGLIDAVLIGLGLFFLGVPLALPLAVLIFFAAFIPIVGATVTGALAVLIALVGHGLTTALIALAIVLTVQQLEGNVLSPILQGHRLKLHPAVVLLAVTAGGALFSVAGALLAVPFAAVAAEVLRYLGEQVELRRAVVDPNRKPGPATTPEAPPTENRRGGR
jgi:predicted PurR-regulated permease PerM